jgi:hypothetical protein
MAKQKTPDDDAEHEVMYKSPGPNPGGQGRTYDWKAAKDAEEKEALIEQGYFPTLEEAYKDAGKPLAKREINSGPDGGKKAATAAKDDRDPITGDSAAKGPTLDDVKAALGKLKDAKDARAVTAVLKQFDVQAAPKLKEEQYADVIAAADEARTK